MKIQSDPSSEIRKQILSQCRDLSIEKVSCLSQEIVARFIAFLKAFLIQPQNSFFTKEIHHVALYKALPYEVSTDSLEEFLRQLHCTFYFPRVASQSSIEFVENPNRFMQGRYGLLEPHSDLKAVDSIEELGNKLDLVIVPGVVFGSHGERIGKGMGYYDRFLTHVTRAIRIALAFDFQIVPELTQNPWDQPVHWIFTEKREIIVKQ